jgi:hypothetical protein
VYWARRLATILRPSLPFATLGRPIYPRQPYLPKGAKGQGPMLNDRAAVSTTDAISLSSSSRSRPTTDSVVALCDNAGDDDSLARWTSPLASARSILTAKAHLWSSSVLKIITTDPKSSDRESHKQGDAEHPISFLSFLQAENVRLRQAIVDLSLHTRVLRSSLSRLEAPTAPRDCLCRTKRQTL